MPFWATSSFKWLLAAAVMFLAIVGVMVFEIIPSMQARDERKLTPPPPPIPEATRALRFDGVLTSVKDGTPPDMAEKCYPYFVRHLMTMDGVVLAKQAHEYSYVHYSKHADDLRGETVKVIGLLAYAPESMRIDPPVDGVEWVYRTILVDTSGDEGYLVHFLDKPPKFDKRQLVRIDGIFLKNAKYDTDKGTATAPFLLARRVTNLVEKGPEDVVNMGPLVVGVGATSMLLVLLLSLRTFRKERARRYSSLPISKIS